MVDLHGRLASREHGWAWGVLNSGITMEFDERRSYIGRRITNTG